MGNNNWTMVLLIRAFRSNASWHSVNTNTKVLPIPSCNCIVRSFLAQSLYLDFCSLDKVE